MGVESKSTNPIAKKISIVGLVALFLTNFAYMSDLVVIPTADIIYGYFLARGVSMSVCNFILSGSQIFAIISAICSVFLIKQFSKRNIILVLYAIFTIATCSTVFYVDALWIAITRAISGLCFGAIFPTGIALIMEIYRDDEEKCGRFIGFSNGTMGFVGGAASIIAGILLGIGLVNGEIAGLRTAFAVYFISVPIWVALLITLPKTPAEKNVEFSREQDIDESKNLKLPIAKTLALVISFAVVNILYCFMTYQYAMYLPEHFQISAGLTAFLGALGGLLSGVAGFCFAKIFKMAGRFTITLSYAIIAIAFVLFGFCADNFALVVIGLILNGFAFGCATPYFYAYAASQFEARYQSQLSSLLTVGFGLGMFLCTYVTTWATSALGLVTLDPATGIEMTNYTAFFQYVPIVAGIAFVVSLICAIRSKKKGEVISE